MVALLEETAELALGYKEQASHSVFKVGLGGYPLTDMIRFVGGDGAAWFLS